MSVVLDTFMLCLACVIAYGDYKHKEIWNYQIFLLFITILLSAWMQNRILNFLYGGLIASAINLLIFLGTFLIYKSEQYGFGDVLIHICIGGYLGLNYYLNYYAITSIIMGLMAMGFILIKKTQKEIPLTPWLLGCLLVYEFLQRPVIMNI